MAPANQLLHLADGDIAYEVEGEGPLVLLVPGMGDLRTTYRLLVPGLVGLGYMVATCDLRGHGQSSTTFTSYGDVPTAGDIAALVTELGGPAVVVGNSMAAGAAVLTAAGHPELVAGLVLVGPFVREPKTNPVMKAVMRAAMVPLWARPVWGAYLPKLYAGAKPADFGDYRQAVGRSLTLPGHAKAFSLTSRTTHAQAEKALPSVSAPVLVLMGAKDPDFADPAGEASWVAAALRGRSVVIPDAGHYPQSQQPQAVLGAMGPFLAEAFGRA